MSYGPLRGWQRLPSSFCSFWPDLQTPVVWGHSVIPFVNKHTLAFANLFSGTASFLNMLLVAM